MMMKAPVGPPIWTLLPPNAEITNQATIAVIIVIIVVITVIVATIAQIAQEPVAEAVPVTIIIAVIRPLLRETVATRKTIRALLQSRRIRVR